LLYPIEHFRSPLANGTSSSAFKEGSEGFAKVIARSLATDLSKLVDTISGSHRADMSIVGAIAAQDGQKRVEGLRAVAYDQLLGSLSEDITVQWEMLQYFELVVQSPGSRVMVSSDWVFGCILSLGAWHLRL